MKISASPAAIGLFALGIVTFSNAPVALAQEEEVVPPAFDAGTWELFGTVELSAGNGTTFHLDGGAGYFLTPAHELGLEAGLAFNGGSAVLAAPFYRFHFHLGSPLWVPYVGAEVGLLYIGGKGGGKKGQAAQSDAFFVAQGMGGVKLLAGPRWSALLQLSVRHDFNRGTDPSLNLFAGLSVYL